MVWFTVVLALPMSLSRFFVTLTFIPVVRAFSAVAMVTTVTVISATIALPTTITITITITITWVCKKPVRRGPPER
nr:Uncharacterised protein [Raoultella sp. NCTC 9187]